MTIETDRHKVIQTKTFRRIKRPDEEVKQWYSNGKLSIHETPDGKIKRWHSNGKLWCHHKPNGELKEWYHNGNLYRHITPDGKTTWGN